MQNKNVWMYQCLDGLFESKQVHQNVYYNHKEIKKNPQQKVIIKESLFVKKSLTLGYL